MNPRDGDPQSPPALYAPTERIHALLEELSKLLDGSLTSLAQHGRSPAITLVDAGAAISLEKRLHAAAERLEQLAELVHSAMQSASRPLGSPAMHKSRPVTFGEAVQHAVEVLGPLATANAVDVRTDLPASIAALPAGALYTVVLNGLQNAIESVGRRCTPGRVRLTARPQPAPDGVGYGRDARDWFLLEITDDGAGPPADPDRCFNLGYSTKPKGAGVGLAVARNVVRGMGGTIDLAPNPAGRGATLRVRFPAIAQPQMTQGGAA